MMRTLLWAVILLGFALPLPIAAMGNGPHPNVPYGLPPVPAPAPVVAVETPPPSAPSVWDHPIYQIAAVIGTGELLLIALMLAIRRVQSGDEE